MTAGSPNGTGLFFPNGLSGFTNATEQTLLGRRRMLATPQEEVYPVVTATSSRKLQQTNSTGTGVRLPPLTQLPVQGRRDVDVVHALLGTCAMTGGLASLIEHLWVSCSAPA